MMVNFDIFKRFYFSNIKMCIINLKIMVKILDDFNGIMFDKS